MSYPVFIFFLLYSHALNAQDTFQLAPPLLKYRSVFFTDRAKLEIKFNQPGATVHYTSNDGEPDLTSPVYNSPVVIRNKKQTIRAKAFAPGLLVSETVTVTFVKEGIRINSISGSTPDPKYPGKGLPGLFDNEGGLPDMGSRTWLGYQADTVDIEIHLGKNRTIHRVLLNLLQQKGSWVWLPASIRLYGSNPGTGSYEPIPARRKNEESVPGNGIIIKEVFPGKKLYTDKLKLELITVKMIPAGNPGEGEHGWLFIDEIKVY